MVRKLAGTGRGRRPGPTGVDQDGGSEVPRLGRQAVGQHVGQAVLVERSASHHGGPAEGSGLGGHLGAAGNRIDGKHRQPAAQPEHQPVEPGGHHRVKAGELRLHLPSAALADDPRIHPGVDGSRARRVAIEHFIDDRVDPVVGRGLVLGLLVGFDNPDDSPAICSAAKARSG